MPNEPKPPTQEDILLQKFREQAGLSHEIRLDVGRRKRTGLLEGLTSIGPPPEGTALRDHLIDLFGGGRFNLRVSLGGKFQEAWEIDCSDVEPKVCPPGMRWAQFLEMQQDGYGYVPSYPVAPSPAPAAPALDFAELLKVLQADRNAQFQQMIALITAMNGRAPGAAPPAAAVDPLAAEYGGLTRALVRRVMRRATDSLFDEGGGDESGDDETEAGTAGGGSQMDAVAAAFVAKMLGLGPEEPAPAATPAPALTPAQATEAAMETERRRRIIATKRQRRADDARPVRHTAGAVPKPKRAPAPKLAHVPTPAPPAAASTTTSAKTTARVDARNGHARNGAVAAATRAVTTTKP
jgi:hypothetical protein